MGSSLLKSPGITSLDATPANPPTSGEGGRGYLKSVNDFVTAVSADDTTSRYRMVRLPTTAKVKSVILNSAVASAGAADIDVAYSDAVGDGTPASLAGTIVQVAGPADNKLFGAAASLVAQVNVNVTFSNTFTQAKSNQPLWQALGLAQDPGGYFDILLRVTTAVTTGGVIGLRVDYVD